MNLNKTVGGYDLATLKSGPVKEVANFSYIAAAEGAVLLKNEKNTLPLCNKKVSVFGRIQNAYYKSGTGSGGMVNVDYKTNILDITASNLNVSNCADFLEELGYEQDDIETNGWEAEAAYYYVHSYLPAITVSGSVYLGELSIYFTKIDDEDIESTLKSSFVSI